MKMLWKDFLNFTALSGQVPGGGGLMLMGIFFNFGKDFFLNYQVFIKYLFSEH